jgi:hypothetical protein
MRIKSKLLSGKRFTPTLITNASTGRRNRPLKIMPYAIRFLATRFLATRTLAAS